MINDQWHITCPIVVVFVVLHDSTCSAVPIRVRDNTQVVRALQVVWYADGCGNRIAAPLRQPNLSAKAKLLAVLVIGGGIAFLWIGPLLIYSFMNNRRRLARGREALEAGDMNLAFDQVHPVTAWTTCSNLEVGNEVLALLATIYQQLGMETKIDEVARFHRKYYEIYNDAKDHQGIVDDEEIGEELHEIFETCRRLAKQLPPPGASPGT